MAAKCSYTPTKEAPYAPEAVLRPRWEAKTREIDGGCLIWTGARCQRKGDKPDEGQLRVCIGLKTYKNLSASRVGWWLQGNGWPAQGAQLRHTCRRVDCVNAAHLRLVTLAQRQRLTAAQRQEIARLHALRVAALREVFGHGNAKRLPSAIALTAKRMWMSYDTVASWLSGGKVDPRHWAAENSSVQELAAVYASCQAEVTRQRRVLAETAAYTVTSLAKTYGVSLSTITSACSD